MRRYLFSLNRSRRNVFNRARVPSSAGHAQTAQGNAGPRASPRPRGESSTRDETKFSAGRGAGLDQPDWIKQIQELATKNSHRESMPVESCKFIFRKDGSLAHLEIVIPTSATRTPNQAGQSHNICSASFDAKDGKLKLSDDLGEIDGRSITCRGRDRREFR